MRQQIFKLIGAAALMVAGGQAFAATVNCDAFTPTAPAYYDDCVGLTNHNTSLARANDAFIGDANYSIEYKDDPNGGTEHNSTVFDLMNNFNGTVTLTFLQNVGDGSSTAVIGLKFGGGNEGNKLGYFLFKNADFDIGETLTFSWYPSFQGDGISHATLYSNVVVPGLEVPNGNVPEPATYALMLAGLAAAGVASRRRRPD